MTETVGKRGEPARFTLNRPPPGDARSEWPGARDGKAMACLTPQVQFAMTYKSERNVMHSGSVGPRKTGGGAASRLAGCQQWHADRQRRCWSGRGSALRRPGCRRHPAVDGTRLFAMQGAAGCPRAFACSRNVHMRLRIVVIPPNRTTSIETQGTAISPEGWPLR
jgi:hypothetical protein